jgi:hypothetical protein
LAKVPVAGFSSYPPVMHPLFVRGEVSVDFFLCFIPSPFRRAWYFVSEREGGWGGARSSGFELDHASGVLVRFVRGGVLLFGFFALFGLLVVFVLDRCLVLLLRSSLPAHSSVACFYSFFFGSLLAVRLPLLSLPVPFTMKSHLPVCPLLVKHTMTAVPASDRLSALQRYVHVAVAALVVDGARGCVDLGGGRWVHGGLLGVVGCGHFDGLVA